MRHNTLQKQPQSQDTAKNPLLANQEPGTTSTLPGNNKERFTSNKDNSDRTPSHPNSNTNLVVVMSETQDNKSALSSGQRQSVTTTTTNACCSTSGNTSACVHKLRRFEPPPPYSANKLDNDAPIDFV